MHAGLVWGHHESIVRFGWVSCWHQATTTLQGWCWYAQLKVLAASPTMPAGAKNWHDSCSGWKNGCVLLVACSIIMFPIVVIGNCGLGMILEDVPGAMTTAGDVVEGIAALGCMVTVGVWEWTVVWMDCSSVLASPVMNASVADCTDWVTRLVCATLEATVVVIDAMVVVVAMVLANTEVDVALQSFSRFGCTDLVLCTELQPRGFILGSSPSHPLHHPHTV